jgi:hypothetical protein
LLLQRQRGSAGERLIPTINAKNLTSHKCSKRPGEEFDHASYLINEPDAVERSF